MASKRAIANLFQANTIVRKKLKTCHEWQHLLSDRFIKVFYKMTICPRQPLLSGPKSDCLIQVWLYCQYKQVLTTQTVKYKEYHCKKQERSINLPIEAMVFATVLSWSPNHKAANFVGIDNTSGCVVDANICPHSTRMNLPLGSTKQ